jgi:superfamily II DNA helicase RecQ
MDFCEGKIKVLVSKPSIFGMGLNYQHCHNMIFCGLSDSFEALYQSIRRCWRFGQEHQVNVHVITSEAEGAVVQNIKEKERRFNEMLSGMISASQEITKENIRGSFRMSDEYNPQEKMVVPEWV